MMPNTAGLNERVLNSSDIIEYARHSMRGEIFTKVPVKTILDGKETIVMQDKWVQVASPVMSEEGIETILSNLSLLASPIISTSNLPEEKIEEMALNTDLAMIASVRANSFKWRIDSSKMRILLTILRDMIYALLGKTKEGWNMEKLTSITTRVEDSSIQVPAPKVSPMRMMGGLFR